MGRVTMKTLYELKKALQTISMMFTNDWMLPVKVDGKEIGSVTLNTDTNEIEICTKKPNLMDFYKDRSLGENIEIKE